MKKMIVVIVMFGLLLSGANLSNISSSSILSPCSSKEDAQSYYSYVSESSSDSLYVTGEKGESGSQAYWTVLVYLVGDADETKPGNTEYNQSSPNGGFMQSLNMLEKTGTNNNINIVLQADDYDCWGQNTRRFLIQRNDTEQSASEFLEKYTEGIDMWTLGEQNSGNPNTLKNFINWGIGNYPASNYALFCFAHGAGWEGYAYDDTSGWVTNKDAYMDINELEAVFKQVPYLDLLLLYGCSMSQIEVYYQLQDYARIILASQSSMCYDRDIFIGPFFYLYGNPQISYLEFASKFVEYYSWSGGIITDGTKTLFAIDCSNSDIDGVVEAVDGLALSLLAGYENPETKEETKSIVEYAFENSEIVVAVRDQWAHDLYRFANKIAEFIGDFPSSQEMIDIKQAVINVKNAINQVNMIKPEDNEENGYYGFAIYSPIRYTIYKVTQADYLHTSFCKNSNWDEFLTKAITKSREKSTKDQGFRYILNNIQQRLLSVISNFLSDLELRVLFQKYFNSINTNSNEIVSIKLN